MIEFKEALQKEQEHITSALQRIISTLPTAVQEIASYALLSGGKRLRPFLSVICARLFDDKIGMENHDLYDAAIVLEMFHVASLLHDDVLDNANLRRGLPTVHTKYGVRACLLAGDALLAAGNRQMAQIAQKYNSLELMEVISNALLYTSSGEIEEINYCGKILPDLQAYYSIIEGKTAWISSAACQVGALMANHNSAEILQENVEKMKTYGHNLGMAFQIVDDALDFAPESETGKPCGGDLREHKCTPPILMYANSLNPEQALDFKRKFAAINDPVFGSNSENPSFSLEEYNKIIAEIISHNYPEQTKQMAKPFLDEAKKALQAHNCMYAKILMQALEYVQIRKK